MTEDKIINPLELADLIDRAVLAHKMREAVEEGRSAEPGDLEH